MFRKKSFLKKTPDKPEATSERNTSKRALSTKQNLLNLTAAVIVAGTVIGQPNQATASAEFSLQDRLSSSFKSMANELASAPAEVKARSAEQSPRIVGGAPAATAVPFMVSIQVRTERGYEHLCGGTIISRYKVLTAAHCFDSLGENASLRINYSANILGNGRMSRVREIYLPDNYTPGSYYNDLAIVRVSSAFRDIAPIAIASPDTAPVVESEGPSVDGIILGWGVTAEDANLLSSTLQIAQVPIQPDGICQASYPDNEAVSDGVSMCAGLPAGGVDACLGDSGGPLLINTPQGSLQVGIVSAGVGCARPDFYGIYTRIENHYDWINAHANGVMMEKPVDMGWHLPPVAGSPEAQAGVTATAPALVRNNSGDRVSVIGFDRIGSGSSNFSLDESDCLGRLSSGRDCDVNVSLTATEPGVYETVLAPALADFNIPVYNQRVKAEIPLLVPEAQAALDTNISQWYTGHDNPFSESGSSPLEGEGIMRSGRSSRETSSFLLARIEGPGTLSFSYQFDPDNAFETARIEFNQEPVRPLVAEPDEWRQVNLSVPAGQHIMAFVVETSLFDDDLDGRLSIDAVKFTGPNAEPMPIDTGSSNDPDDIDGTDGDDTDGGSGSDDGANPGNGSNSGSGSDTNGGSNSGSGSNNGGGDSGNDDAAVSNFIDQLFQAINGTLSGPMASLFNEFLESLIASIMGGNNNQ